MNSKTNNAPTTRKPAAHNDAINHYLFCGTLKLLQATHVGSGYGDETTDALVLRSQSGVPIIAGSSLRGVLRSQSERLLAALHAAGATELWACGLYNDTLPPGKEFCVGNQIHQDSRDKYNEVVERPDSSDYAWQHLPDLLCDACLLFGAGTFWASKIRFTDLAPLNSKPATAVRHGVGIHRDSGTAAPGVKFDKEVVEAGARFQFEAVAENLNANDLVILALAFASLRDGELTIGGSSGRGLGQCILENGKVYRVNLKKRQQLLKYVTTPASSPPAERFASSKGLSDFVNEQFATLHEMIDEEE